MISTFSLPPSILKSLLLLSLFLPSHSHAACQLPYYPPFDVFQPTKKVNGYDHPTTQHNIEKTSTRPGWAGGD